MPHGRGIYIPTHYFDAIEYSSGGTTVELIKSIILDGHYKKDDDGARIEKNNNLL